MATETDNLKLIKPENGEYEDVWEEPFNENMDKVDDALGALKLEVLAARFTKSTLKAFLEVSHNTDGTLKPTTEVGDARSSRYYGFQTPAPLNFTLVQRLEAHEKETFEARRGEASLSDALAKYQYGAKNKIISGAKDINGYPTYVGAAADKALVNGSSVPLVFQIGGYIYRERTLREVTLTGSAGLRYILATRPSSPRIILDMDSSSAPPATASGIITSDANNNQIYLNDATQDFTAEDIKPGDTLQIIGTAAAGDYIIKEVAPGGLVTRLVIVGKFTIPGTSLSGINYLVVDSRSTDLSFGTTETNDDQTITLAEVDWDGSAITAVRPRHFGDTFVSEWRAVDVGSAPNFEEIFQHGLGSDMLDISVQVCPVDDGSQPVEQLSLARVANNLGVSIGNTLAVNITGEQTLDPGTSDAALEGATTASLSGAVTGGITGTVTMENSVASKWTKNQIWVKNLVGSHFYRDYAGVHQAQGFLRVIVQKRG